MCISIHMCMYMCMQACISMPSTHTQPMTRAWWGRALAAHLHIYFVFLFPN